MVLTKNAPELTGLLNISPGIFQEGSHAPRCKSGYESPRFLMGRSARYVALGEFFLLLWCGGLFLASILQAEIG